MLATLDKRLTHLETQHRRSHRPVVADISVCGLGQLFPDEGPYRRDLYAKHLEFFDAGATHRERGFMAAHRVGKTESGGGYELALHLTGLYPAWWTGRRFDRPIVAWAAGDTGKTVRDILQRKFFGKQDALGTGLLPAETILHTTPKSGVPEAIEMARIRHASGRPSYLTLKSYDQKVEAFYGEEIDAILLDEEPPLNIYVQCLIRTMTTNGLVMLTFTPLQGLSDTVLQFCPEGQLPDGPQDGSKYLVNAGWDDVPHLSEEAKAELRKAVPAYLLDAMTRGLPILGAGAIFPVPEDTYLVDDFDIPKHWKRAYGMDVGWNCTACPWGAYDPEADTWYLYNEYYRGQAEPSIHAAAIKARGEWIPGCIDPAANGRSQRDGRQLLADYCAMGLDLTMADNTREAGMYQVWERLSTGRLKVFRSLSNWRKEVRLFRRDDKGRIVNEHDFHLMASTRYLIMTGLDVAKTVPVGKKPAPDLTGFHFGDRPSQYAWMG